MITEIVRVIASDFASTVTLGNCSKNWIFNYKELTSFDFSLTLSKVGFYHCPKGDKVFYLAVG